MHPLKELLGEGVRRLQAGRPSADLLCRLARVGACAGEGRADAEQVPGMRAVEVSARDMLREGGSMSEPTYGPSYYEIKRELDAAKAEIKRLREGIEEIKGWSLLEHRNEDWLRERLRALLAGEDGKP